MSIAERIKKLGFKRWYERSLIESHAYLVTSFLGMILTFAALELFLKHEGAASFLIGFVTAAIGAIIAGLGFHRYLRGFILARNLGERATCPQCGTYAAFIVTAASSVSETAGADETPWLKVKCRKCANQWTM